MSFSFDPKHAVQDLQMLQKAAAKFFAPRTAERINRLARYLEVGLAANDRTRTQFHWGTERENPIVIANSRTWKGNSGRCDPIFAEITLDYVCSFTESDRLIANGVAVLAIRDPEKGGSKIIHFDAEIGGWTEESQHGPVGRAGHPPLHAQFHGFINDLPRVPTLVVHPIDVIYFGLLELHQKDFRDHLGRTETKQRLGRVPQRQKMRVNSVLDSWKCQIEHEPYHPLIAIQRPFKQPCAL